MEPGAMRRYIPPSPKSISSRRQAAFLPIGPVMKRRRSSSSDEARLRSSSAGASGEEAIDEQDCQGLLRLQAEASCQEAWENLGSFFDLLQWTPKGAQAKND